MRVCVCVRVALVKEIGAHAFRSVSERTGHPGARLVAVLKKKHNTTRRIYHVAHAQWGRGSTSCRTVRFRTTTP